MTITACLFKKPRSLWRVGNGCQLACTAQPVVSLTLPVWAGHPHRKGLGTKLAGYRYQMRKWRNLFAERGIKMADAINPRHSHLRSHLYTPRPWGQWWSFEGIHKCNMSALCLNKFWRVWPEIVKSSFNDLKRPTSTYREEVREHVKRSQTTDLRPQPRRSKGKGE